jgi:hypothetical protein
VFLDRLGSILERAKLDIGIHGLASHALHDDVDRFIGVVQDARSAPEQSDNLRLRRSEGNLVAFSD